MNTNWKIAVWFVSGFVIGALIISLVARQGWLSMNNTTGTNEEDAGQEIDQGTGTPDNGTSATTSDDGVIGVDADVSAENTAVTIVDQAAGESVLVQRAVLPVNGWIVVHEIVNGHVSNALGAARRDTGVHEDVSVSLLRDTEAGREYIVVLYEDNGNGTFEIHSDLPILGAGGQPVMAQFSTISE